MHTGRSCISGRADFTIHSPLHTASHRPAASHLAPLNDKIIRKNRNAGAIFAEIEKNPIGIGGKIKLLKFAAVYGANAAGKSNLVKAMNFMRHVVVEGFPDGHTEKFCKIDTKNRDKPSYFEIEIKLGEKLCT